MKAKTTSTGGGDAEQKKALEALRESEAKFSAAFHSMPTALVITRLSDSQFDYVNESFLKLVGYERDEVIGKTPDELNIFPNPEEMATIRKSLLESKIVRNVDTTIRSKNNELRHVLFSVDIIQLNGQPSSLTTMVDITERIQAEKKVVQMKRLYATLSQVNQTIVRVKSPEELYQSICDVALKFGELTFAWIGLLDEGTGNIRPVAARGASVDIAHWPFPIMNIHGGPSRNGVIVEAMQTSNTVTSADVQTDERTTALHDVIQKFGFHSLAAVPFRLRGKTIGVLVMISVESGIFEAGDELKLLDELSLDISFALDTMETEAERRQAAKKIERQNQRLSVLREIDVAILAADSVENIVGAALSHIRELIDCRRANLTLIDRGTNELVIFEVRTAGETSIPAGSRLPLAQFEDIIQILSQNQPILFSDYRTVADPIPGIQRLLKDGLLSTCSLPLFSQGRLIGMFSMHSEIPGFFDEEKIALGREVANQVAIALTQNHLVEELRESEEQYRAFFENSLDAILLTSPDGSIQAANPAACKMLGRTEAEICALSRSELVDTNDPSVAVLLEERAKTGKSFGELTMIRNDGSRFPAEMSSALFQDRQGNTRTSMIIRDITERKRAEDEARGKQQLFQKTFDINPLASVLSKLPERTVVDANPAFEKLFGYPRADMIGRSVMEFDLWADASEREGVAKILGKGDSVHGYEFVFKTKSGETGNGVFYSEIIEQLAEKYVLVQVLDITERKQAEERVRYQAHLLENVNDAIVASDAQFRLKAWNLAAEGMYGWKAEEVLGRNGVEILQTAFSEADAEEMRRQIAESGYYVGEATQLRKDGTRIPVEVASMILRDDTGKITDYVSVNRDITERKRAEEALRLENLRFQRFVEANIVGIVIANAAGKIITANDYYLKILGLTRQDFEDGKVDWRRFTPPEWLPADEKAIQELREHGICEPYEKEYERADGTRVPVYIADAMLPGPEEQIAAFVLDITARKQAEQRVRESEQKYSILFDKSAVPAALLRLPEVVIVEVNEALEKLTGYTRQELLGKTAVEVGLGGRDERERMIAQFQEQGALADNETPMFTKSGDQRIIVANTNPLRLNGQPYALTTIQDITERRRAENALRSSQAQMSGIFNSAMDAILSIDAEQRIVIFNPAAEKMFRWSQSEAMGQPLERLIPERFRTSHASFIQNFAQRGVTNRTMGGDLGTIYGLRKDGEEFPIEASISKTHLSGKDLLTVILRDITERKRAEEELRISEERFSKAFFASPAGLTITRITDGKFIDANDAFLRMYEFSRAEVIGHTSTELNMLSPEERAKLIQAQLESGGLRNTELQAQAKSGRIVNILFSSKPMELGGETCHVTTMIDITERKRAEQQIQRQLKHLNALRKIDTAISSSFDLQVVLDVVLQQVLAELEVDASAILLVNPQLQTIEYATSRGFHSTLQHTQLQLNEGYASRAVRERQTIHIQDLRAAGGKLAEVMQPADEKFVDYYGAPLIVKEEIKGVLEIYHRSTLHPDPEWLDFLETLAGQAAIAIDNAQLFENLQRSNIQLEHRVAERTLELNQSNLELEHANRAKDEFLATMSHELRTPLNSILGLSESLLEQRRDPITEYQQKSLQIIQASGSHLLELINDILDLSKIEAGKFNHFPEMISVSELCRSSLAFVKEQAIHKSITLTYREETAVSKVLADPRRLKQILVNLLTNAVKFTPEHGQVTLQVHADPEQDRIQFSVIDSGIGIALKDLRQLFVPFKQVDSRLTRDYEGTGLGLALVQKLTDLHGGSVDVESEVGKGSRFTINLPWGQVRLAQEKVNETSGERLTSEQAGKSNPPAEEPLAHRIVLLAEDNQANILTISDYLESHAYQVVVAHDGLEAIEKAEEIHPDIILMDIQMPVMDGFESIRRLRANPRFASTPVIALTALAMPGDRERCLEVGANEYMSKPASLKGLVKNINQLLRKEE